MMKPKREMLDECTIKATGEVIKVGDTVLMRAEDLDDAPYAARMEKIEMDEHNNVMVGVRWYYRPEESISGRRKWHGAKELFLSDHYDMQSAETILDKCTVHSFKNYTKLDTVDDHDYFSRFEYKAATGTFIPGKVVVYCKCETPYNPDNLMLQCEDEKCKDWFHLECMNLNIEQAKAIEHFFCPDCLKDREKKQGNPTKDSLLQQSSVSQSGKEIIEMTN